MKIAAKSVALLSVAVLLAASVSLAQQASLKAGDKAPDFKLMGSDGKEYTLAGLLGKHVVLCWFPRAGSQGAINQCASLQAVLDKIPADKVQVFGCSAAALDVTTAFARQGNYGFPVLADPTHAAALAYGCLRPDGVAPERWTFLMDDRGVITAVNRNTSPQTQGADLVKMLTDAGLMPGATATTPQPAASTPVLKPGGWFTVKFPEMPPTLFALSTKRTDPAQMTVFLPRNYDPQRKHPLFIFLNGSDGGNASNPTIARALTEEQDFICVALPLFKISLDPNSPVDKPPVILVRGADGQYGWPFVRTMLAKLDQIVPNIDPDHRILGGSSNGAHATAALIDGSDGEVTRMFSAFMFGEGGGGLQHYELLKGKPFLMLSSNAKSLPRATKIADTAKAAGALTTLIFEDIGQHGFPPAAYPKIREWLRGPAMQ